MDVSFDYVNHILATLPIGYYLGRNIPVTLSEGQNSVFNPVADKITIGYALITEAFKKVTDGKYNVDVEEIVRGLLYHEISHVVLTPDALWDAASFSHKRKVNVFEDERIETLLAKTYMNTNFKKNIVFLNSYDGTTEPKTADDAFYHVVRYHHGKKEFIDRVANIIHQYAHINKLYGTRIGREDYFKYNDIIKIELRMVESYAKAIIKLYEDIAKDFEENQQNNDDQQNQQNNEDQQNDQNNDQNSEDQNDNNNSQNSEDQNEDNNDGSSSSQNNDEDENEDESEDQSGSSSDESDDESNDESNSDESNNDESDDESNGTNTSSEENNDDDSDDTTNDQTEDNNELTDEQVQDLIEDLDTRMTDEELQSIFKDTVKSVVEVLNEPELTARLKKVIDEKLKENDKNGAAISAYSGRFDYRALARRDDYKWWNQQNINGDIRRFSKVHFNLFIDNSGSFEDNDFNMNKFIQSLNRITSKDFDFDVITINTEVVEWPDTTSRMFASDGCNRLHADIAKVVRRHTQTQSNNYNIILFDGNARPDFYSDGSNAFKYFDGPNTILVTDDQNEQYVKTTMRQAKVIITDDYCNKFIDTVCKLLERVI
jgi:hypothetical protein